VFTAGAHTSQRSESLNVMIKVWGHLKKQMKTFNLVELMLHVDYVTRQILEKQLSELSSIINKKKGWGEFVQAKWENNSNARRSRLINIMCGGLKTIQHVG
jgi:hypothetical protein